MTSSIMSVVGAGERGISREEKERSSRGRESSREAPGKRLLALSVGEETSTRRAEPSTKVVDEDEWPMSHFHFFCVAALRYSKKRLDD